MPRIHLPYRGDARPKVYGYPSPPKPSHCAIDQIFWFVFTIVGIGIFCFAINLAPSNNFGGFFAFGIYLIFLVIANFAFRDAKRVKTITPDKEFETPEQEQKDEDAPAPAEDRFIEVEEAPAHINTPISRWRYRIVKNNASTHRFFVIIFLGMCLLVGIAIVFGPTSPVTIGLITIICLAFLANYLMKD